MPARVVAVAASSIHSFPKTRQSAISVIAGLGVQADAHCGVTVKHRSRVVRDPTQRNLRQVHLILCALLRPRARTSGRPRSTAMLSRIGAALLSAAAALMHTAVRAEPASAASAQTQVHVLDGHRVTLDVYPVAGAVRGAAILSHGFTRSRQTLAGHARALADAGVLALTPDLPCTFDFRCNARALAALVGLLRAGEAFGAPVEKVMLVGFSAGGLSSLLAADTPGVAGFVGLDPFDREMRGDTERLGLTAARPLRTEVLLMRAPPSRCNADAVAAPWATALPRLWRDEVIAEASHCDFESPTDWMCRMACGDEDPARQQRVRQGLLDAAARWLP